MRTVPTWKLVVLKKEARCGGCGDLLEPGGRYSPVRVWKFPGRLMVRCQSCGVRHVRSVDAERRRRTA